MACSLHISITFLLLVLKCDGQIIFNPQDEINCTGDSVTLNWAYTTTNQIVATWRFGSSTIMTSVGGANPTKESAYSSRATHGGNGVLTLTGLSTADSGSYSFGVTYSSAVGSVSDSVQVTVYDKISQESIPQCDTDTNTVKCGNSSLSGVIYAWTVDGSATRDSSWSISSRGGTKTYACTLSGDRVTNCLDAGITTTNSKSCTFEANESGLSPGAIAGIVIAVCVAVIAAVVIPLILWKKKLLCFKVPTEEKPTGSTNSGIRSTSPNQVKPSVENSTPMVENSNVTNSKVDTKENSKVPILDIENKKRHTGVELLTERSEGQPEINQKKPLPSIGQ